MTKKYVLVVRDKIITFKPKTDETLKFFDCYYQSPAFTLDVNSAPIDYVIDKFQHNFRHFLDWNAELVEVQ